MEKSINSIENCSAYVTHGINTPLTYLKAHLELMGSDINTMDSSKLKIELKESKKKMQEAIAEIEKVVNHIHSITKGTD